MVRCVAASLLALACSASPLSAQDTTAVVPIEGTYELGTCQPAHFPSQLPDVGEVVDDATALRARLAALGLRRPIVFAVRPGAAESPATVRLIEGKLSRERADTATRLVAASLRAPSPVAALRLRVDPAGEGVLAIERARVCTGQLEPIRRYEVRTVTADELPRLEQEIERSNRRFRQLRLTALIDSTGKVIDARITRSSGDLELDRVMITTFRIRRFKPTTLDGAPVAAWIRMGDDK